MLNAECVLSRVEYVNQICASTLSELSSSFLLHETSIPLIHDDAALRGGILRRNDAAIDFVDVNRQRLVTNGGVNFKDSAVA